MIKQQGQWSRDVSSNQLPGCCSSNYKGLFVTPQMKQGSQTAHGRGERSKRSHPIGCKGGTAKKNTSCQRTAGCSPSETLGWSCVQQHPPRSQALTSNALQTRTEKRNKEQENPPLHQAVMTTHLWCKRVCSAEVVVRY